MKMSHFAIFLIKNEILDPTHPILVNFRADEAFFTLKISKKLIFAHFSFYKIFFKFFS